MVGACHARTLSDCRVTIKTERRKQPEMRICFHSCNRMELTWWTVGCGGVGAESNESCVECSAQLRPRSDSCSAIAGAHWRRFDDGDPLLETSPDLRHTSPLRSRSTARSATVLLTPDLTARSLPCLTQGLPSHSGAYAAADRSSRIIQISIRRHAGVPPSEPPASLSTAQSPRFTRLFALQSWTWIHFTT